ncbi:MAG: hypothetical protein WA715_03040 [Candidatus Acidiferrum sp.]
MKKAIFICMVAWMCMQSSSRAQSGPDSPSLTAKNEIPSSLVAPLVSRSRTGGEPYRSAPLQKFVCNKGYTQKECDDEMVVLRKGLANYRASDLGGWTWVLVRSEDWKLLLLARGLDPGIPALTFPSTRTTFFEEALVAGPTGRVSELMGVWHLGRQSLLDLAIRHELGHALCNDVNERTAERVAKLLEERKSVTCGAMAGPKRGVYE